MPLLTTQSAKSFGLNNFISGSLPSFYSIATATPSGVSTFNFNSIPSTYRYLEIRGIVANTQSTNSDISCLIRFNNDTGNSYVCARTTYDANVASGTQADWTGTSPTTGLNSGIANNGGNDGYSFMVWRIYDYTNTNKNTTTYCMTGDAQAPSGIRNEYFNSGVWLNTTTVNAITMYLNTSSFASGTQLALYGVK